MGADFWIVLQWWGTLFFVGAIAFPLTRALFSGHVTRGPAGRDEGWWDQGYFFAKAVGMVVVTYLVYLSAILHIVPFTQMSVFGALIVLFLIGMGLSLGRAKGSLSHWRKSFVLVLIEEIFFFLALLFWSWVKGHEPSIHGLEKFMDYGFMKSILNSRYFPAPDMWYAGLSINYYYFGHTVVAVLTKLSGLDLAYTFNLMLATLFAFTLTMSFSIGYQLFWVKSERGKLPVFGGILTALLVTLAGNMQTIYAFTRGYTGEDVKPFWQLLWPLGVWWSSLPEGLERYWYANATRFIPFTIHEFPSYSFVVSDVHGHVLSLPFTILAIALLIHLFTSHKPLIERHRESVITCVFYGLLVAVLLMTNALDGPIYLGLFVLLFMVTNWSALTDWISWTNTAVMTGVALLASIPFMSHFSSFVSGVALNCPPAILANRKVGILLFEGIEKCQHSPLWMMWLLWGFFIFCGGWLLVNVFKKGDGFRVKSGITVLNTKMTQIDLLLIVFFLFSLILIIFPEFFYFKDIYPAHFRSNTMFKLGYQAFILFSIVSGYTITRMVMGAKVEGRKRFFSKRTLFIVLLIPQLFLVLIYPMFSVRSYFDSLRTYKGLDGTMWLAEQYPDDYAAIQWLNENAKDYTQQGSPSGLGTIMTGTPVIIEMDGDSYTDSARISAFTGLPAVIGWPVHEWLWRGTYDVVAPRREEVRTIYESDDMDETRAVIQKYGIRYIIVGKMEKDKFTSMHTEKFDELGELVFIQGDTAVYRVSSE